MDSIVGKKAIIKKEWMDDGDENFDFIVREDNGNRVLVECIMPGFTFNPTQVILKDMIEKFI